MTTPNDSMGNSNRVTTEITFLDILVVLIKRRRIVLGIPAVLGILAATVLYIFPLLGLTDTRPEPQYEAQLVLELFPVPSSTVQELEFSTLSLLRHLLSDTAFVGAVYAKVAPSNFHEIDSSDYNVYIRDTIIQDNLVLRHDRSTGLVTLRYTDPDEQRAIEFLSELVASVQMELSSQFQRRIVSETEQRRNALNLVENELRRVLLETWEQVESNSVAELGDHLHLVAGNVGIFTQQAIEMELLSQLSVASGFPFAYESSISVFQVPTVDTRRSLLLVVSVLTALAASVLLAFVLEYINRVRQDPSESARVRAAWRKE